MVKFISFGKINQNYKYFLLHVLFLLINEFLFYPEFFPDIKFFSQDKLTQLLMNYLGIFFISRFFIRYEIFQRKSINRILYNKIKQLSHEKAHEKIVFNEYDLKGKISIIKIIFVALLFIIEVLLMDVYQNLGLSGIDFWMFELLFLSILMHEKLNISIALHKKFSIGFILIFSTIFKLISSILILNDKDINKIYKEYVIIIPMAIIGYILIIFLKSYININ